MDEMSSAEFRLAYAKLGKPVKVTANGHAIGWWIPTDSAVQVVAQLKDGSAHSWGMPGGSGGVSRVTVADGVERPGGGGGAFGEFRPVPKPSQRKR